jgi:hypothetical protein
MLLRCATGMMRGPLGLAAGFAFAGGIAAGVALGAGAAAAAMLGKRMWEERQGWSSGTTDDTPPAEPADAPLT